MAAFFFLKLFRQLRLWPVAPATTGEKTHLLWGYHASCIVRKLVFLWTCIILSLLVAHRFKTSKVSPSGPSHFFVFAAASFQTSPAWAVVPEESVPDKSPRPMARTLHPAVPAVPAVPSWKGMQTGPTGLPGESWWWDSWWPNWIAWCKKRWLDWSKMTANSLPTILIESSRRLGNSHGNQVCPCRCFGLLLPRNVF